MAITLPDPMQRWIEAQAASGQFDDASDFIRDLVCREQERCDKIAAMQRLVDDGRASGISDRSTAEIREDALAARE